MLLRSGRVIRKKIVQKSEAQNESVEEGVPQARRGRPVRRSVPGQDDKNEHLAQGMNDMMLVISGFLDMNPPSFSGTEVSDEGEIWLNRLEYLFNLMQYEADLRLELAVLQLRGDAYRWWNATKKYVLNVSENDVNWETFRVQFIKYYFPPSYFKVEAPEFDKLIQGNLPVGEYIRQFSSLLIHVPHVARSDSAKRSIFMGGLKRDLFMMVLRSFPSSYEEAVNTALTIELEMKIYDQRHRLQRMGGGASNQGGFSSYQPQQSQFPFSQPYYQSPSQPSYQSPAQPQFVQPSFQFPPQPHQSSQQRFRPRDKSFKKKNQSISSSFQSSRGGSFSRHFCDRCGGRHLTSQCFGVSGRCHKCEQLGHYARVCPNTSIVQF